MFVMYFLDIVRNNHEDLLDVSNYVILFWSCEFVQV